MWTREIIVSYLLQTSWSISEAQSHNTRAQKWLAIAQYRVVFAHNQH